MDVNGIPCIFPPLDYDQIDKLRVGVDQVFVITETDIFEDDIGRECYDIDPLTVTAIKPLTPGGDILDGCRIELEDGRQFDKSELSMYTGSEWDW